MGILIQSKTLCSVLFLFLFITSCGAVSRTPQSGADRAATPSGTPSSTPNRAPAPPERIDRELEAQLRKIAETSGGQVGVGAVLLETGDSVWLERSGRFASQSVYKLPIAMAVMKLVDEGKVRIDQDITITPEDFVRRGFNSPIRNVNPHGTIMPLNEVVRFSISESDGTASDVLLDLAGGPEAVQEYLAGIGITDFIVADSEKSISKDWETQYRNWATPEASIELLRALHERNAGISGWTTDILLRAMIDSETGRRRLKRGLPEGAILAHKTGTGGRQSEIPGFRANTNTNTNTNTNVIVASTENANAKSIRSIKANENFNKAANRKSAVSTSHPITSATNDIGIITLPGGRHILIAVYIMDSSADTPTRESVIAKTAKAISDKWSGTTPEN